MSQLVQLREKIKAVQTTKKITHAVRLVSMSLYAKLEKKNSALLYYFTNIRRIFSMVRHHSVGIKNIEFFNVPADQGAPLIVIVAPSKGLCGNLTSNLIHFMHDRLSLNLTQQAKFIIIGNKGADFVKGQDQGNVIHFYPELNSHNYLSITEDLVGRLTHPSHSFSSVTFYSTKLGSFFNQKPEESVLIPFSSMKEAASDMPQKGEEDFIWEQSQQEILLQVATNYCRSFIMNVLYQAVLSEHAARFLAMDFSTTNATKYLERLTLQYNKIRQTSITREVIELAGNEH